MTMAWKLIVAAEAPWTGELYLTRPGHQRLPFNTVETFCSAVLAVTAWPLHAASAAGAGQPPQNARPRVGRCREKPSTKRKFIVAADEPWAGHLYRTRPGLGHLPFATFEQFLRAVLDITGWALDHNAAGSREYALAGPGLSRPISAR
ncbi:hypothetical protein M1247_10540 [Mycobacterium sp. 21AC1]|uniref:hypothetical protein n=1 Tax=[Mycobacterium] appelbergii TaxID=2939269 RepID=UPI00293925F0|nr:hypothetical protein [Mycobacterium sp. 21AC1]MDV3125350.1 hypothetical protein [Mycobacterium sp. 21AC1]